MLSLSMSRRDLMRSVLGCTSFGLSCLSAQARPFADQFPLPWQKSSLANGVRLFVAPTDSAYISALLRVRFGEINERPNEDGLAHFLEHVMAKGGAGPYSDVVANELRDGFVQENAETTLQHISFSAELAPDQLPSFLDIAGRSLFEPRLERRIVEQERMRVVEELSEWGNSREFRDMRRFDQALYGKHHPLSTFCPEMEIKTIRAASCADLRSFHERMARANLVDLFLVGGLPDTVATLADRTIGSYRTPRGRAASMRPVPMLTRRSIIGPLKAPDLMAGRTQFKLGWNSEVFFGHRDMAAMIVSLKHLDAMLAETVSDRLGMVYGLGLSFQPSRASASIIIDGSTQARPSQIIDAILSVVDDVRRVPMSAKQLQRKKSHLRYLASKRMLDNREVMKRLQRYAEFGTSYFETGIETVTPEKALAAASAHFPKKSGNFVVLFRQAT